MDQELEESKSTLGEYATPVLGAIVILAILVGGWYLLRGRPTQPEEGGITEEMLASPTPTPTPEIPQATPPSVSQLPKGIEQLPNAGFPAPVVGAVSLLALAAGWKLRKLHS